jgi:methyltransferase (TIGR00027 family)
MTRKGVEQQPSETAMFAALRRALANKRYANERLGPDYLAECFLPAHFRFFLQFRRVRANTRDKLDSLLPGLSEYVIARTAYFDDLFKDALKNRLPQIALLGAGYDSRAYRFAKMNEGTRVFELDIAPTQERKKKCLERARVEIPQQVKFVPINFNEEPLGEVLEESGFENGEVALFIWEGVSYYLDMESVDATLDYISHLANRESSIALDYAVSLSDENVNDYYGAKEFARIMREQHADEELKFSVDEGEIGSFLRQRDLKIVDHLDNEEIERAYLVDEDGLSTGRMTGHFRFVVASPRDEE